MKKKIEVSPVLVFSASIADVSVTFLQSDYGHISEFNLVGGLVDRHDG